MRLVRQLWLLAALLCCTASGRAEEISVTAELQPATFAVDQEAVLVVTVNGASEVQPELPAAEGLHFRSLGQSQQTSWINGQVSASVAFSFGVRAEQPGQHRIGPVKVRVNGKDYASQPLTFVVGPALGGTSGRRSVPPAPNAQPEPAGEDIGNITIEPQSSSFYVGQIVPFAIKACFQPGRRIQVKNSPRFSGEHFLLHQLDNEPQQEEERLPGGGSCIALTWRGNFSAVKEGAAPLAVELDIDLMVREKTMRQADPFGSPLLDDPFFDDFFAHYIRREIRLASPDKPVTALPLPAKNRPADFKGAVGLFSMAVAASPADLKPGDPITLRMKITGSGNFDRVQAPELSESAGWKLYPPAEQFSGQAEKGEKTFEQAAVPISGKLNAVPSLRFSYFDPAAKDYVTLTSEPIPIRIQGAAAEPAPPVQQQPLPETKRRQAAPPPAFVPGESVLLLQPLHEQRRFQAVMAGAGCCLAAGLLLDLRRRRLEANPGPALRRQAERRLAQDCRAMRTAAAAADQEGFRQHCQEAVRRWIGTVWGMNAAAVTLADLREQLPADSPLLAIFSRLEESGYAGQVLAQEEMAAMLETVRTELVKLT
uniref:BatD family protein n=1 Tax=Candidatus Electronema sp. TaxID=2698783 RepID=UPI004055C48B